MKKVLKVLGIIAVVILAIIIALVAFLIWASKQPAVKDGYYEDIKSDCPLESKYIAKGESEVAYFESEAEGKAWKKYEVWYPEDMKDSSKTYPLVIMVNGTGVPATKYKPIFEHLASWGFIVAGNEDDSSWDGSSSSATLDFMLAQNSDSDSVFYGKIDVDNIGIGGHSQGGVGTINAVTNYANGERYKAMYTASATHIVLSEALNWPYDVSKVNIPYFMTAGTKQADAGDGKENSQNVGIAPLFSLQENFDKIPDSVCKIMARRKDADHGDMLAYADGYMTAWFMYWLKGDAQAEKIFYGADAEITANANWQDVERKNFD